MKPAEGNLLVGLFFPRGVAMRSVTRLGDLLVTKGLVTQEQLTEALQLQRKTGKRLGETLVELGYITEEQLAFELSRQSGLPIANLNEEPLDPTLLSLLPEQFFKRFRVLPAKVEGRVLHLAMVDPFDVQVIDDVRRLTGLEVKPLLSTPSDINAAYQRHLDLQDSADQVIGDLSEEEDSDLLFEQNLADMDVGHVPGVRIVNLIIHQAVTSNASDVHLQPEESEVVVRFRIDGVLRKVMTLPKRLHPDLVSRLKVMANLDITNRRMPQDGRLRVLVENNTIDVRVSTLPTVNGEKVVLRLPNRNLATVSLEEIGFLEDSVYRIEQMLIQNQGLILVTGPTGSGKTTTLYSFIRRLNVPDVNIVTVEDPVEYRMPGITQVQVRRRGGIDFADGLRAVLRQDPDIVMVGEIRDAETASVAVRASLTGHLVLSTLHTNDAAQTVVRLLDLGIEPYLLSATLIGVVSQRLVRKLCNRCKRATRNLEPADRLFLGMEEATVYQSVGCPACNHTGFTGRIPIEEVLIMTKELRQQIKKGLDEQVIAKLAKAQGMKTIKENAIERVLKGETTVLEAARSVYTLDELVSGDKVFGGAGL